jgi:hypothetical protein
MTIASSACYETESPLGLECPRRSARLSTFCPGAMFLGSDGSNVTSCGRSRSAQTNDVTTRFNVNFGYVVLQSKHHRTLPLSPMNDCDQYT